MKKFKLKYSPSIGIILILIIGILLFGIYFGTSDLIYKIKNFETQIYKPVLSLTFGFILLVLSLSFIINKKYTVNNDYVILSSGFVQIKYKINDIISFSHFKSSDKLVAYFAENKYTVIIISPKYYDEFVKTVKTVNPAIIYSVDDKIN